MPPQFLDDTDGFDPNRPFIKRKRKLEPSSDGNMRVVEEFHSRHYGPDGSLQIDDDAAYLCEGCGQVSVVPGQNGVVWQGRILCTKCRGRARWKWVLTPLWSPFLKTK